jgi:hypothetical protein
MPDVARLGRASNPGRPTQKTMKRVAMIDARRAAPGPTHVFNTRLVGGRVKAPKLLPGSLGAKSRHAGERPQGQAEPPTRRSPFRLLGDITMGAPSSGSRGVEEQGAEPGHSPIAWLLAFPRSSADRPAQATAVGHDSWRARGVVMPVCVEPGLGAAPACRSDDAC